MMRIWGVVVFTVVLFACSLVKGETTEDVFQDEDAPLVDIYRQIAKSVAVLECPDLKGKPRIIRTALDDAFVKHGYGLDETWVEQMSQLVKFYSGGSAYLEKTFDIGYISRDKHDFLLVIDAKSNQSRTYVISPKHEGVFCGEKMQLVAEAAKN